MRVAIITESFAPDVNGVANSVVRIAEHLVARGHSPLIIAPEPATSGLVAAILAQDAFASGSFPAALTAMTAADPIAAWLWGALLFDQVPPSNMVALASLAAAGILISTGVAILAYSPTITATA